MNKLNIIIADKHPVVRIGLEKLVRGELGLHVGIISCTDLKEMGSYVNRSNKPADLLLVGHAFRDVNEIRKLVNASRKKYGYGLPVLVFSEFDEPVYAPLCLAAGALGFVHRTAGLSVLGEAIDTVLKGGYFIYGKPIRCLKERKTLLNHVGNPLISLSQREREICEYLIQRHSCMAISDMLNVHRSTVSTYKCRIFKKLNVHTDTQLAELWNCFTGNNIGISSS